MFVFLVASTTVNIWAFDPSFCLGLVFYLKCYFWCLAKSPRPVINTSVQKDQDTAYYDLVFLSLVRVALLIPVGFPSDTCCLLLKIDLTVFCFFFGMSLDFLKRDLYLINRFILL